MPFTFTNNTNTQINVRISNAGITYHWINELPAGCTAVCTDQPIPSGQYSFVNASTPGPAAIWYDITAYYSSPTTKINPSTDNVAAAATIITSVVGVLTGIAGVLLLPVGGVGVPILIGAGVAIAGVMTTAGGIAVSIAGAILYPAALSNMYGPHDYHITVSGGFQVMPDGGNGFNIMAVLPIGLVWTNQTNRTNSSVSGKIEYGDVPRTLSKRTDLDENVHGVEMLSISLPYKQS